MTDGIAEVASSHEERVAIAKALTWDITEISPDEVREIIAKLSTEGFALRPLHPGTSGEGGPRGWPQPYQHRVATAHHALFHDDPTDVSERLARYAEETNEVLQAFGMSRDDMHCLVDYTCDRPAGEPAQEIGAAMLTLTSLCVVAGYDLMSCAEADLQKLQQPETIARIRAKRSTRHGRGPLPGFDPSSRGKDDGHEVEAEITTIEARFDEINRVLGAGPREDWMRPLEEEFAFLRGRLSILSATNQTAATALIRASVDVLEERDRQKSVEGWSPEHDDQHIDHELSRAAASYAIGNIAYWPWSLTWWKPADRRRNLVKAGALIIAEIERIDRAALSVANGDAK